MEDGAVKGKGKGKEGGRKGGMGWDGGEGGWIIMAEMEENNYRCTLLELGGTREEEEGDGVVRGGTADIIGNDGIDPKYYQISRGPDLLIAFTRLIIRLHMQKGALIRRRWYGV